MNIDNLLSVINKLNTGISVEPEISGKLNLTDFMVQNLSLDIGQKIVLQINGDNLSLTDIMGKTVKLPINSLSIDKITQFNEPVEIAAKIINNQESHIAIEIKTINDKPVNGYLRQEGKISNITNSTDITNATNIKDVTDVTEQPVAVIVKDLTGLKNIPLQNMKVNDISKPILKDIPLPPEQQEYLSNELQKIEITFQIKNIPTETEKTIQPEKLPIQQKIIENINELPIKLSNIPPSQIENTIQKEVQNLGKELQQFQGQIISGTVVEEGFSTPLGIIHPEIEISLPPETVVELEITDIINTIPEKQSSHRGYTDNVLKNIEKIKNEDPQLYEKIAAKLPADNADMLKNMTAFTKAAVKNDIRQWLGEDIVVELENKGETGKAILSELQSTLQGSNRQSPLWRVIEIPYYVENHLEQIRLAIKQYPDEDDSEEMPKEKFGTRFIVDTNFTQLGAFQFDGFSFAKDRRFDLIIRTARHIDDVLCANIMRIFKQTLNDVQYIGTIKINLKENFIKISENNPEDNVLAQGLFI